MAKTLIIYAHPETKGHCSQILEEVEALLKSRRKNYELIDLYKIKYDPVLKTSEHYTHGNRNIDPKNKVFQKKILNSQYLIFIYPNWWNSMPAILKGFIDKVFTSRFAFTYVGKYFIKVPQGLLKGRKAAIFYSTGAPLFIHKTYAGYRPGKLMKKDILKFCGIKSKVFPIGNANKFTDKQHKKIKKSVSKGIGYLYS